MSSGAIMAILQTHNLGRNLTCQLLPKKNPISVNGDLEKTTIQ